MGRLRYLNPFRIREAARQVRAISGGGGPKRLRLVSVGEPRGIVIPIARVVLEVEATNGTKARFEPGVPVPWPYAWTWRLARLLRVPLVRSFDAERFGFTVPVPRRSR